MLLKLDKRPNSAQTPHSWGFSMKSMNLSRQPISQVESLNRSGQVTLRLRAEREALGLYLSGHPLEKFRSDLLRLGCLNTEALSSYTDGSTVSVAGVITFLKLKNTKKGDRYATFVLEDLLGTIEAIVWPDTYQKVHDILSSEDPVLIKARLDVSDERRVLIANEVHSVIRVRDQSATQACIRLRHAQCAPERLKLLKSLLSEHPGECSVRLILSRPQHSETTLSLPKELNVAPSEASEQQN